ncbi:MAG: hypothetical protein N2490_08745 [Ignavibacteria bacterium]|nr:hypothetical protein [Ignavibacteria bacterium]
MVLSSITTGNDRVYTGIDIKVYKNTDSEIVLVQDAFVRVKGVNNSYCETCYTSYSGKCRKQINQAGYYSFCASKDNYEDGKTVYVSGGTMEVYLYLDNYGSCEPCLYPEGKEK